MARPLDQDFCSGQPLGKDFCIGQPLGKDFCSGQQLGKDFCIGQSLGKDLYSDDLTILELVMLGEILTQYDSLNNVYQRFLPTQRLESQKNLDKISSWTKENLMELNESKTNYLIFTRSNTPISTSLSINEKIIERKKETKLLGVWLEEDGRWNKNTRELCKKGYARVSMITKLKYAGVSIEERIHNYKQFVRVVLEYCSVAWHSSLTERSTLPGAGQGSLPQNHPGGQLCIVFCGLRDDRALHTC